MFIDKNDFESWMKRIMERFERLENKMDKPEKSIYTIDGEKLLDNQDLCFMLNCSKRTLQRYRVSGLLPCKRFDQKTYYLESDVINFIREHLQKPDGSPGK
jgi:DNA-binding transcriptional MerR regulator